MKETYRGTVYPWQCDTFNHLNVQYYVAKFDEAAWQFLGSIGISPNYFRDEERGMVAMEQKIRYYKELLGGDLLYIKTELLEVRSKSMRFKHLMYNAISDEVVAEMEVISIHLNTRTRRSCDFPPGIRAKLDVTLSGE